MVLHSHDGGLVIVSFPTTSIGMSVGFVFSHNESGKGDDDGLDDDLNDNKFIMFVSRGLIIYSFL